MANEFFLLTRYEREKMVLVEGFRGIRGAVWVNIWSKLEKKESMRRCILWKNRSACTGNNWENTGWQNRPQWWTLIHHFKSLTKLQVIFFLFIDWCNVNKISNPSKMPLSLQISTNIFPYKYKVSIERIVSKDFKVLSDTTAEAVY